MYWLIGTILAIVTAVEVFWPLLGVGEVGLVGGLVALMILKGAMVVMWFMHLKGDAPVFQFVFIAPLTLAVVFVLAFLLLFEGTHAGVAG
ncbi:MAG: oxidase [Roseiflexaceae bacterium]|nr:oxidase [Roseiflexaceae bacterium]